MKEEEEEAEATQILISRLLPPPDPLKGEEADMAFISANDHPKSAEREEEGRGLRGRFRCFYLPRSSTAFNGQ